MTTSTTSYAELLRSPAYLNQFLSGIEEASALLHSPAATTSNQAGNSDFHQISASVYGFFLTIGSYLLRALCMTDLSKRVWVQSRHVFSEEAAVKTDQVFKEHLLAKAVNTHRLDTADYFLTPASASTLHTHPSAPNTLHFFQQEGLCRGMCLWFVQLYFKTLGSLPDAESHLKALGKQFEQGAPRQAAFLHSLDFPSLDDLLSFPVKNNHIKITPAGKTEDRIIGILQALPPSVYGIYLASHEVVYIKLDESRHYLFDPQVGLIKVTSPSVFKQAMGSYLQSHDATQEVLVDVYKARS
jgi:hypothetical protein